jgi:dephospho-CoA kinase
VKVLGITGGIGSGKSTVCMIFKTLGVPVFSSDEVSKSILFSSDTQKDVSNIFGDIVLKDGLLDKKRLGDYIFSNESALKSLNKLLHPRVGKAFQVWKEQQNSFFVIKEAAILFESGADKYCDFVVNVSCNEGDRIKRVLKRDNRSESEIKSIIKKQWDENKRAKHSDFIINNESEKLIPQVLNLFFRLKKKF